MPRNKTFVGSSASWLMGAVAILSLLIVAPAHAQVTLPLGSTGTMGLGDPNGDFFVAQDDLSVKVPGGVVRINRDFDGSQWTFNRQWSGLGSPAYYKARYPTIGSYYSCTIIDGVNSCDTTAQAGTGLILPPPPPQVTETRIDTDPNFGLDPYGHPLPDSSTIPLITRKGIVFSRSTDGVSYTSSKFPRFIIRPQMVPVLPGSTGPDANPAPGKPGHGGLPTAMVQGYRWTDRSGAWIEYDNFGRISSYGDRDDVRVWMQYSNHHYRLERVLDDNGRTVFTLLYTADGQFITEARDHTPLDGSIRRVRYEYDGGGRLTKVTDARGNPTVYTYGTPGSVGAINSTPSTFFNIKTVTDAENRLTQIGYGITGRMETLTAPDGGVTNFEYGYDKLKKEFSVTIKHPQTSSGRKIETLHYDVEGRVVYREVNGKVLMTASGDRRSMSYIDERGSTVTVNHDNFDGLTRKLFPDGSSFTLTYESASLDVKEAVDEKGVVTRLTHDDKGNLRAVTAAADTPEQQVTEYEVNARGEPEVIRRKGGANPDGSIDTDVELHLDYDDNGNVHHLIDGEGKTWTYAFDAQGNLMQSLDPLGHAWNYTYDEHGNRLTATDPNQQTYHYSYDKTDRLLTVTDPRGKVARLDHDAAGRLSKVTDATGSSMSEEFDVGGRMTGVIDALSHRARIDYDNQDRASAVTDGEGNITHLDYTDVDGTDHGSDLVSRIDYPTVQELLRYNSRQAATQIAEVVDGQTRSRTVGYDVRGAVTSATNAYGKSDTATPDALNRPSEGTDAQGHTVRFAYDHRDNLIAATDANGHTTHFAYDHRDLLIRETNAVGESTVYTYDDAGRLKELRRATGAKLVFDFDDGGRLRSRQSIRPDGSLESTDTFTWETGDRLASWTTGQASGTATHDDAGRLLSETVTIDGAAMTRSYTYYLNGQVKTYTGPDGVTVTYNYDGNANLSRVDIPNEGAISIVERKVSAPTKVVLPGGTTQEMERNGLLERTRLRVKSPSQTTVFDQQYQYGLEGELSNRTTQGRQVSYTYDDAMRLKQADPSGSGNGPTETFELDAADNRLHDNVETSTWIYDDANRLKQRGDVSYEYDAAGNLTRKIDASLAEPRRTTRYAYDGYNRLTEVYDGTDQLVSRYRYDAFGYRISKEVTATGAAESGAIAGKRYFLQGEEGVLAEINADGTVRQSYGWHPDQAYGTAPLYLHAGNQYYYYHVDDVGQPRLLTDKTGQVVWSADRISAFGAVTIASGTAIEQPWRFPGQYYDAETGLHYNVHRYYDPSIGRYTSADPAGLKGGFNGYAYANAMPTVLVDPYGLAACDCGGGGKLASFVQGVTDTAISIVEGAVLFAAGAVIVTLAAPEVIAGAIIYGAAAGLGIVGAADVGWGLGESIVGQDVSFSSKTHSFETRELCDNERAYRFGSSLTGLAALGAAKAGERSVRGCSFDDDTLVQTDHGLVRIADIKIGDKVLARDEKTGQESYQEVLATLVDWHESTLTLTIDKDGFQEAIITTDEHPFYVAGKGFVPAANVAIGDEVQLAGSGVAHVVGSKENHNGQLAYNLTVANDHTYFVGRSQALVHNACTVPDHHIMTNKNSKSPARGGPWTPRFEDMARRAGMDLNDAENRVRVPGHRGPHPQEYHEAVFDRLQTGTRGLEGDAYSSAFRAELEKIRTEVATPGSDLNKLVVP